MIEIEVDSLEQLQDVLPAGPDIVLVDNFSIPQLMQAVELRNVWHPKWSLKPVETLNSIRSLRSLKQV